MPDTESTLATHTKRSDIESILLSAQAADNTLAQIALQLKDQDTKQAIGAALINALLASVENGAAFSAIKIGTKQGVLSINFKLPTNQFVMDKVVAPR